MKAQNRKGENIMNYQKTIADIFDTLRAYGIPCNKEKLWNGFAIRFPWCDGDVAMHSGTYGNSMGHVESYKFSWDEGDVTHMTPEKAVEFITHEYITYLRRMAGIDAEEEEGEDKFLGILDDYALECTEHANDCDPENE